MREAACVLGAGLQATDVVALQFLERQVADERPLPVEEPPFGPAGDVRIEPRVVRDYDHPVAREAHVELERGHADGQRTRKAGQGVLGCQASRAAVALQIERAGGGGGERERRNDADDRSQQVRPHGS